MRTGAGILWILCLCMLGSARGEDGGGSAEFAARRARLSALLDSSSAAVFRAPEGRTRNNDVNYPYRQESNLLYLTGANRPDIALIVAPGGVVVGDTVARVVLFVQRDGGTMARIDDGITLDWSRFGEVLEGCAPVWRRSMPRRSVLHFCRTGSTRNHFSSNGRAAVNLSAGSRI